MILLSRAIELVKKQAFKDAYSILMNALEYADEIENIGEKTVAFIQVARLMYFIGRERKAREILDSIMEELGDITTDRGEFLRLTVEVESVRLGFVEADELENRLENIREKLYGFVMKYSSEEMSRYFLAFIVLIWAPYMLENNIQKAVDVLGGIVRDFSHLKEDPQYAEVLTTLAEVYARLRKVDDALTKLKNAIEIYKRNLDEFRDTIRSILEFVRENFPDKYDEFLREVDITE